MTAPYYEADGITLYLGDCLEVTEWLAADVLVIEERYCEIAARRLAQGVLL
jgi:site-specific DNA-methyltransferase (adenine-specific)